MLDPSDNASQRGVDLHLFAWLAAHSPIELSQTELRERLGWSRRKVVDAVGRLAQNGWRHTKPGSRGRLRYMVAPGSSPISTDRLARLEARVARLTEDLACLRGNESTDIGQPVPLTSLEVEQVQQAWERAWRDSSMPSPWVEIYAVWRESGLEWERLRGWLKESYEQVWLG
ncbi:MAG: hypothetical protein ABIK85_08695, partial [Candidatus Eisenbacteria bacterium]